MLALAEGLTVIVTGTYGETSNFDFDTTHMGWGGNLKKKQKSTDKTVATRLGGV